MAIASVLQLMGTARSNAPTSPLAWDNSPDTSPPNTEPNGSSTRKTDAASAVAALFCFLVRVLLRSRADDSSARVSAHDMPPYSTAETDAGATELARLAHPVTIRETTAMNSILLIIIRKPLIFCIILIQVFAGSSRAPCSNRDSLPWVIKCYYSVIHPFTTNSLVKRGVSICNA